jgi:hypothetical protein
MGWSHDRHNAAVPKDLKIKKRSVNNRQTPAPMPNDIGLTGMAGIQGERR